MKAVAYIKVFVPVAIVLCFTLQKGNGVFFLMLLPFFFVMMFFSIIRMIRRPLERKNRLIGVAVWSATLILAGAMQVHWDTVSRADADRVAVTVLAYRDRTGVYPVGLEELGLDEEVLGKWKIRYRLLEGKAVLNYPASFMPLTLWEYDFDAHKWWRNSY